MIPTLLIGVFFIFGCSQGTSPVSPAPEEVAAPISSEVSNSHTIMGLYQLVCNPAENTVDIISLRETDFHLNALRFLEPPQNLYLKIVPPIKINGNIIDLNLSLTHPFLSLVQYTGFDVCGIIFTHGSYSGFHNPEITMAGAGDTRLLNADGYSRWWNPAEFPHGKTMFNYIDGLLGTPAAKANYNSTLNGYKYYADGLKSNDPLSLLNPAKRGMFGAGQTNVRHYTIDMTAGLIFNYAVDACWCPPTGKPPYVAPGSFPKAANRPEAYNIRVTEIYNTLYFDQEHEFAGGNLKLQIDVWDHFNCSLNQVWGESLDGLPYVGMAAPLGGTDAYSTYELDFNGGNLTHSGTGEILIEVRSEAVGYPPSLPDKPLCAYFTHRFNISSVAPEHPDGWAVTWGGNENERCFGVVTDSDGNSYVAGYFRQTVDFDPGDGEYLLTTIGGSDISLSKFNPLGEFQWVRTWGSTNNPPLWGGSEGEQAFAIDIDSMENLYISGYFEGTVDFDPGSGVDEHTAISDMDAFLSKFDIDGNFIWARTWGGNGPGGWYWSNDCGRFVRVDHSDNVYVGGYFSSDIDLDPGAGVDLHTNSGSQDIYLSRFDTAGNFIWGRSWGGTQADQLYAIAVNSSGTVFTTGSFGGNVDFDPGGGTDMHASNGSGDVFLTKFNMNGDYLGTVTMGGPGNDVAEGVSLSLTDDVYIAGNFYNTVDFNPGSGVDNHNSNGDWDVFLTKFSPSGAYNWTLTWGGPATEDVHAMSIRGGNVFATGHFGNTMDFDPTSGLDLRTSNGGSDIYLIKVDCFAHYMWTRTWGGTGDEYSRGFTADKLGNLFIAGGFSSPSIDFDPGPSVDIHQTHGFLDVYLVKMLPNGYW